MDIIAVHKAAKWAREWTLSGKGPVLLEMVTYRYGGHSCVYFLLTFFFILVVRRRHSDALSTTLRSRSRVETSGSCPRFIY